MRIEIWRKNKMTNFSKMIKLSENFDIQNKLEMKTDAEIIVVSSISPLESE